MHNIAPMTEDQEAIRDAVAAVCAQFDAEYWRKTDETGEWPVPVHRWLLAPTAELTPALVARAIARG